VQHLRQQFRHRLIVVRARPPRPGFIMQARKPPRDEPLLPVRDRR